MQPSATTRASSSATAKSGSSADARLQCPVCGLTAQELYDSGRMGCASCYDTFAAMVERAAIELHGMADAGRKTAPPPLPADRHISPWPTRKALPSRSSDS